VRSFILVYQQRIIVANC